MDRKTPPDRMEDDGQMVDGFRMVVVVVVDYFMVVVFWWLVIVVFIVVGSCVFMYDSCSL